MLTTIAMGGHLRVGMEDNVMYHRGVPAESNAQFVARAKRLIEEAGFEAAKPDEAREILGLTRQGILTGKEISFIFSRQVVRQMTKKRIISAALTGNWGTKEINPNIPMSPEEIAQAAYEAWQAGASIVHLHMRTNFLRPTMDVDRFRQLYPTYPGAL